MMNALALTAALAMGVVQARPMHADIVPHYRRYLEEQQDVEVELEAWMTKFKETASSNGWIPPSESRSADEEKEDHKQRFFLTKERIKDLEQQNPDAQFSTDSPFTLLTDEEFNSYVGNAYRKADDPVTRKLRGMHNGGSHNGKGGRGKNHQRSSATMTQDRSASSSSNTDAKSAGWSYMGSWQGDRNGGSNGNTATSWNDWWNAVTINHSNINNNYKPATAAPYNPDTAAPATSAPSADSGGDSSPVVAPESNSDDSSSNNLPVAPEYTPEPAADNNTPTLTSAPQPATDDTPAPASDTGYDFDTVSQPVASDADASAQGSSGKVDWSTTACVSPIQNQGQCGSCWAFASIAAVESAQCIAGGQKSLTKYSEQQLASCDTKNYGCNGGAPVYAFDYIKNNGVCTESAYPYTSSNGKNAACTASCQKTDPGIKGSAKVSGEDGLLSTLAQHPVVVAVAAGNNAWKQYTGGVLSSCDTTQVDHAVLAIGYDADTIKIKNSWGDRWGEAGYIRLKRGTGGQGTCGIITDMSHPLV
ncbi:Cysteine protease family c01a [Globisporangium polare]